MGIGEDTSRCWHRIWKPEEDEFIRANYLQHSQDWFREHFKCGYAALLKRMIHLGLSPARPARWREYNTKKLKQVYGKIGVREIARQMGFSESYVQQQAAKFGLHSDLPGRYDRGLDRKSA